MNPPIYLSRSRPNTREDIPLSFDSITPEWMTDVLCREHPGAYVSSFMFESRDEGTTNRRRIWIKYNEVGERVGRPASVFCKASHGFANRLILAAASAVGELTCYDKIRPLLEIEAPRGYFAKYDRRSYNSMVMMSDLGSRAEFCAHTTPITRSRAESQMHLLASVHDRFHQSQELDEIAPDVMTFEGYFRHLGHVWKQCCEAGFLAAEALTYLPPKPWLPETNHLSVKPLPQHTLLSKPEGVGVTRCEHIDASLAREPTKQNAILIFMVLFGRVRNWPGAR